MLRMQLIGGQEVTLESAADIKLYRYIKNGNKVSASDFHDQFVRQDASPTVIYALAAERYITEAYIWELVKLKTIAIDKIDHYLPMEMMSNQFVAQLTSGKLMSNKILKELYFRSAIRAEAIPLQKAIEFAQYLHQMLIANEVDAAVIPSHVVKLDELHIAILEKLQCQLKRQQDAEVEKTMAKLGVTEDMTHEDVERKKVELGITEWTQNQIWPIICKSNPLVGELQVLLDAISNIIVDAEDIEVAARKVASTKLPECHQVQEFVQFAREYAEYSHTIQNYLLKLKDEISAVREKMQANSANSNREAAKAGAGISVHASAMVGERSFVASDVDRMFGAFSLRGSATFSMVSAIFAPLNEFYMLDQLHEVLGAVNSNMDINDIFSHLSRVIDTLCPKCRNAEVEKIRSDNVAKIAKLQFMPVVKQELKTNLLAVPVAGKTSQDAPRSPRLASRSRNPTPVVSQSTNPSPFRKK